MSTVPQVLHSICQTASQTTLRAFLQTADMSTKVTGQKKSLKKSACVDQICFEAFCQAHIEKLENITSGCYHLHSICSVAEG